MLKLTLKYLCKMSPAEVQLQISHELRLESATLPKRTRNREKQRNKSQLKTATRRPLTNRAARTAEKHHARGVRERSVICCGRKRESEF